MTGIARFRTIAATALMSCGVGLFVTHPAFLQGAESGAASTGAAGAGTVEAVTADASVDAPKGVAAASTTEKLERGKRLVGLAQCQACHTADGDDAVPFAGGHAIKTSFGTFYGSNLTPDPKHGIGTWSDATFIRAMRNGRAPDGHRYWPAFPYGSYAGMTDDDLLAIKAWLLTLPPSSRVNQPHQVSSAYRPGIVRAYWQWRYLKPGPLKPDPAQSELWNRGRYLAETVGHCGECHTPRNGTGGLIASRAYHGAPYGSRGRMAPDLTPSEGALAEWAASDWETFFTSGMDPEGDTVGGHMYRIVDEGTSKLPEADRQALATYFLSLPKHAATGAKKSKPASDE